MPAIDLCLSCIQTTPSIILERPLPRLSSQPLSACVVSALGDGNQHEKRPSPPDSSVRGLPREPALCSAKNSVLQLWKQSTRTERNRGSQ